MRKPLTKEQKARMAARMRERYRTNRAGHRDKTRARNAEEKRKVFSHYAGGTAVCACCGETEYDFLTLDHINRDGAAHRRTISGRHASGAVLYRWLIRNNFPPGLQILCYNCNCGAHVAGGVCPHKQQNTNRNATFPT